MKKESKSFDEKVQEIMRKNKESTLWVSLSNDKAYVRQQHVDKPIPGRAIAMYRREGEGPTVCMASAIGKPIGDAADIVLGSKQNKLAMRIGQEEVYISSKSLLKPDENIILFFESYSCSVLITASSFNCFDENGIFYFLAFGEEMAARQRQCFLNIAMLIAPEETTQFFTLEDGQVIDFS